MPHYCPNKQTKKALATYIAITIKLAESKAVYWCHNPSKSMVVSIKMLLHSYTYSLQVQKYNVQAC